MIALAVAVALAAQTSVEPDSSLTRREPAPAADTREPQPAAAAAAVTPAVLQVAVAPLQADAPSRAVLPGNIDDVVLQAVQVSGRFDVVGQSDIKAMLEHEADKSLLSCSGESCMSEVAQALGVDQLVAVEIAELDGTWVVTAKLIDVKRASVLARQRVDVDGGPRALVDGVVTGVRRLFDPTWRPPERPLLTPSLVAGVGAGALALGAAGSAVWAVSSLLQRNGRYDAYRSSIAPVDAQAYNDAVAADAQMWLATALAGGLAVAAGGVTALALVLRHFEDAE